MRVPGGDAKSMIDYNQAPITRVILCDRDDAIRRGVYWGAVIRGDVYAGMEGAFTAERIQTFAKAVGNVTEHRPDRRRVAGIRKAHRRHQSQAAAGDRDYRGVAL